MGIDKETAREAFDLINEFRGEHNLSAFVWSEELYEITLVHSKHQAKIGDINHDGGDGRARQFHASSWAENVHWHTLHSSKSKNARAIVEGWKNSPGHRKNMLKDLHYSAVSVSVANGKMYATQFIANRTQSRL